LVKVEADAQERTQVISIADIFRANIVDVSVDTLMIEMTGNQNKIEAFLHLLDNYKILKIARTGITGLARGMVAQDTELYEKHKGEL
jgi:acetolactate synthase-1/3 small subunit